MVSEVTPIGKCPMCLGEKESARSHLMPARIYDYLRPEGGHSISMSSKVVMASDRELKAPLLCAECEDLLNRGGET